MLATHERILSLALTVYRVLKEASRFSRWNRRDSAKGTGFLQPLTPHEHWHVDVSYFDVCGTFYYLTNVLDGCSRFIVDWKLRENMRASTRSVQLA